MTNQQGAPEALRPIARYKIGYHTDEWGVRSSTPGGITDPSGQWVLYKDHLAALASHGQTPARADMQDAYVGAREDLAIWKRRALEAERLLAAAPQPVACEPLTDEQIEALPLWKRFVGLWPETRREIVRTIEHHHGIKGGQHVGNVD